jgi:molybdopterin molybdotransferase
MSEFTDPARLSVEQYQAKVLAAVKPAPAVALPLLESLGLVSVEDVRAEVALPNFDNSAMDGYAVRYGDVLAASSEAPLRIVVCGEIGAGSSDITELPPGAVAKIMTGAPMPAGADSVVPYEWTDRAALDVRIDRSPSLGQNVRYAGEDVAVGDLVVASGTVLGPRQLALLAAVGRSSVVARPRPRVAVIATGSELRPPGHALERGAIYNSNSYLLAACVARAGGVAVFAGTAGDTPRDFLDVVEQQLAEADVVITSGGVSMGDFDVVKRTLAPRGVWFGPVAMQPGKPQGFGVLTEPLADLARERRVPLLALPGNPVASFVSFTLFAIPLLRRLMGITPEIEPPEKAVLATGLRTRPGRREFWRGRLIDGVVTPITGNGSHMLGRLVEANCLIVIDEARESVAAGETVEVLSIADL